MFNRTLIYTVHVPKGYAPRQDEAEFIREGFNFWAFLFTLFWALYHRMWVIAIFLLSIMIFIGTLGNSGYINPPSVWLINLGIQLVVGFMGNDWLRAKYNERGYVFTDIVVGDTALKAKQRFYERLLPSAQGLV